MTLIQLVRPALDAGNELDPGRESTRVWAALRRVSGEIRRLREIRTLRQLLDATPAALCRIGFDRAMVSRVEESTWVVERFYGMGDAAWSAQVDEFARSSPQRLSPCLLETEMLRRRSTILVTGAQYDARVSRPLAEATRSTSYVAAPIMPDGRVIGFLHADHYHRGVEVDRFDLEVLSYFAEQFSHVLERTLLLERLDGLRSSIGTLTQTLNDDARDCRHAGIDMSPEGPYSPALRAAPQPAATSVSRKPTLAPDQMLTAREREVLQLMATGDTNARIASRLVVSEGTVKTHVKNILRKLAAANRAEAVCRWFQRPELG